MANSHLLWVRDAVSDSADYGNPSSRSYDLLWKARTGRTIHDSNVALREEPPPVGDPRILYDRPLAPQDITGALVKRVILYYQIVFSALPDALVDGTGTERHTQAGNYEAIGMGNFSTQGFVTFSSQQVGSEDGSVTGDWLWWRRRFMYENPGQPQALASIAGVDPLPGSTTYLASYSIDTRCSRRIDEWDQTLRFYIEPSVDETINATSASWSVLLHLP